MYSLCYFHCIANIQSHSYKHCHLASYLIDKQYIHSDYYTPNKKDHSIHTNYH